jgi:hypothetical protein
VMQNILFSRIFTFRAYSVSFFFHFVGVALFLPDGMSILALCKYVSLRLATKSGQAYFIWFDVPFIVSSTV